MMVGQVLRDDECVLDGEGVQVPYAVSRVEFVEVLDGRSSEAAVTVVQPRDGSGDRPGFVPVSG